MSIECYRTIIGLLAVTASYNISDNYGNNNQSSVDGDGDTLMSSISSIQALQTAISAIEKLLDPKLKPRAP